MRNRRPTPGYEGRILITPENPEIAPFFARVAMADNPIDTGTPMTAETFLKTVTASMLGLDPQEAVPDDALQVLAALASSRVGGDAGELEDFELETGSFVNAGAGWNTCKFKRPFASPPQLFAKAKDFEGILQIKNVTADGFLYQLKTTTVSGGSYHTATSAAKVSIQYLAVHFGGER